MHHRRTREQLGEHSSQQPADNISSEITDQEKSGTGLGSMLEQADRIRLGQMMKKEIADDHVVLSIKGFLKCILTESVEFNIKKLRSLACVVQSN